MINKIYTKTGDKGFTSLIGGTRVFKSDARLEAYGTADELNSFIGLFRSKLISLDDLSKELLEIQNFLFQIGACLATDTSKMATWLKSEEILDRVSLFESKIDEMNEQLPDLRDFIIPGGSESAALCHVCRTICRRLERKIYCLESQDSMSDILMYVNRLSDYFFVLARYIGHLQGTQEILRE